MNKLKVWFSFLLRDLVFPPEEEMTCNFMCYILCVSHMCVSITKLLQGNKLP